MKHILIILFACGTFQASAQINWKETSDWKIYKVAGPIIFKIQTDSLKKQMSRPLQKDSLLAFFKTSSILADSVNPVWMGGWVATYEYRGQVHKIEISAYAGFFLDQSSGRYYQIPIELREEWMSYINQNLSAL